MTASSNDITVPHDLGDLARTVGANLQRVRDLRGVSTSELSRDSGIARTTIHKLEQGQANPTLETLYTLARSLAVGITDLVAPSQQAHLDLVRASDAVMIKSSAGFVSLLTRIDAVDSLIEVLSLSLKQGERIHGSVHQQGVIEHVIVQYGTVEGGPDARPITLSEGDYLRFGGETPHSYVAVDGETSLVLLMETRRTK